MKKLFIMAAVVAGISSSVQASDIVYQSSGLRDTDTVSVANRFNGCYGGVNGGYSVGDHQNEIDFGPVTLGYELGSSGGSYGLQGGCDFSVSEKVFFGVLGNWNKSNLETNQYLDPLISYSVGAEDYWSLGARAGYKINDISAVYVMAGYREYELTQNIDFPLAPAFSSETDMSLKGAFLGAGFERYITNNISLFAEGDYFFSTSQPNDDNNILSGRAGLNIRFDGLR